MRPFWLHGSINRLSDMYAFESSIFVLDGQSRRLYVLKRLPANATDACTALYHLDDEDGVKLEFGLDGDGLPALAITATSLADPIWAELSTSIMPMVFQSGMGAGYNYLAQAGVRIELLRTEQGEDGEFRLVLDGVGVTYLEGTDPIQFKLFQFDPSQTIYLAMRSPDTMGRVRYQGVEGLDMDFLQISWTASTAKAARR